MVMDVPEPEVLREVWRVTARVGDAVYSAEYVEDRWIPMSESRRRPNGDPDLQYVVKSTSYEGPTIRRKQQ